MSMCIFDYKYICIMGRGVERGGGMSDHLIIINNLANQSITRNKRNHFFFNVILIIRNNDLLFSKSS